MKRILILTALIAFLAVPAFAETTGTGHYTTPCTYFTEYLNTVNPVTHTHELPDEARVKLGVEANFPNLIRFTKNSTLGIRGGKEMYNDPFVDSGRWVEDDKGFFGMLSYNYSGSIFDFSK